MPTEQEAAFVEECALTMETMGLPRMGGRVLGWLLICDPPHQTQQQLAEVIQASKASISTMLRLLEQLGMVRRMTLPGDRREYVTVPDGGITQMVIRKMQGHQTMLELVRSGLSAIAGTSSERQQRLREMLDFHEYFARELPLMIERWEQERAARQRKETAPPRRKAARR